MERDIIDDLLVDTANKDDDEDDDEETMTAAEVLSRLEEAWLNEKFCPDLLPVKDNLVDCMMAQIHAMENNIIKAKKGDFRIGVHRMEIDRIRYVVSSYLRHRLTKIEMFTRNILEREENRQEHEEPLLSDEELQFAKGYQDSVKTHLHNQILKHMPHNFTDLDKKQSVVRPNVDSYVFLKVNEDTPNVLVEEETVEAGEEIMDFEKGDQHIMRYKLVAPMVESGAFSLI